MKKFFQLTLVFAVALLVTSCATTQITPKAVSNLNKTVTMSELNLTSNDYQIIKTETAEAVVVYDEGGVLNASFKISEVNKEFTYEMKQTNKFKFWQAPVFEPYFTGILKYGFLSSDYDENDIIYSPSSIAKGLATYRLINAVQEQGADGVIEPITTIKVGNNGNKVVYTATISAKLVKIKAK